MVEAWVVAGHAVVGITNIISMGMAIMEVLEAFLARILCIELHPILIGFRSLAGATSLSKLALAGASASRCTALVGGTRGCILDGVVGLVGDIG